MLIFRTDYYKPNNYLPRKRFWWSFCPLGDYYKTCSPSSCGWRAGGEPREARYSAKSSLYNENIYNNIIDNDINNILRRAPCTIQLGLIIWFSVLALWLKIWKNVFVFVFVYVNYAIKILFQIPPEEHLKNVIWAII